jgi:hypothetical protein
MARDLIPPPSPAGRPAPDGTPNLIELPPETPAETSAEPAAPAAPSQYRNRFGFLIGGLAGVVIATAAIAALVIAGSGPPDEGFASNWSKWRPQDSTMTSGAAEIATHVGGEYRGDKGEQLVNVTGGPLEIQGLKLGVLLRPAQGNIHEIGGKAVLYNLNGLGPRGSIKGGKPSTARHRLLRREALELALYTFRYVPNVDMVVTLLPPPPPSASAASSSSSSSSSSATADPPLQAVFYRPGDLRSQLQVPLGVTVPAKAPRADTMPPAEIRTIDSLTLSNLFQASFTQAQNLQPYLVLDRPS